MVLLIVHTVINNHVYHLLYAVFCPVRNTYWNTLLLLFSVTFASIRIALIHSRSFCLFTLSVHLVFSHYIYTFPVCSPFSFLFRLLFSSPTPHLQIGTTHTLFSTPPHFPSYSIGIFHCHLFLLFSSSLLTSFHCQHPSTHHTHPPHSQKTQRTRTYS